MWWYAVSIGYLVSCCVCPAQIHFRLRICSITSVTFVFSLTQIFVPDVMFDILLSISFFAAARLFFAWVVSAHVSTPYVIAGSTHAWIVDLSLQAYTNITLEDVAVLGECCPFGSDSSLNLIVLVLVSGGVSLRQVDVAFNIFDLSVVDIYWCVVFHHHLCLQFVICRPWFSLSSANLCSMSCMCCSSCGVLACMSMSSAKRRWLRYSPSIFKPQVSKLVAFESCRKQRSTVILVYLHSNFNNSSSGNHSFCTVHKPTCFLNVVTLVRWSR